MLAWKFETFSLRIREKLWIYLFQKKMFPLDANKAASTTVPKRLRQWSQFSTQIPGPLLISSFFLKICDFHPKVWKLSAPWLKRIHRLIISSHFFALNVPLDIWNVVWANLPIVFVGGPKIPSTKSEMYSKKTFSRKKICFLSKCSFEHVNHRFQEPAKISSPNVLDYFASCPKKWRIYSFKNNYHFAKCSFGQVESSFENPADRFLSHSGKNFRPKSENNHEIVTILQKIISQKLLLDL